MKTSKFLFIVTWLIVGYAWIVNDRLESMFFMAMAFAVALTSIIIEAIERNK